MAINLSNYQSKAADSIKAFWGNRDKARQKQIEAGKKDQGERSSVTAGANMDGFVALVIDLVKDNGLKHVTIQKKRSLLTLPGFFRPTKKWDVVIIHEKRLIAAIELKSQVGSFGKNFNNRAEEAIGTAHDFWTAYREGAFGKQPRPFLGWLMHVEDHPESHAVIKDSAPNFPVFKDFLGTSILQRYDRLCQKLVQEQLYTTASVIASPRSAITTGKYTELSDMTSLKTFVTALAGHIATEAAR